MQQTKKEVKVIEMAIQKAKFRFLNTDIKNEIVIIGRLDPVKGLQKALEDFSKIKKKISPVTLRIMGEPKNVSKQTLESWVLAAGLMVGRDVFVEYKRVEHIEEYMNQALLGWVCSEGSEYICRVAYEFLMCGTPMLVSRVNSLQSIFNYQDGRIYSLQAHSRIDDMVNFISELMNSDHNSREVRSKRFQTIHSYSAHAQKILNI